MVVVVDNDVSRVPASHTSSSAADAALSLSTDDDLQQPQLSDEDRQMVTSFTCFLAVCFKT